MMTAEQIAFIMIREMSDLKRGYGSVYEDCFKNICKTRNIEYDEELMKEAVSKAKSVFEFYGFAQCEEERE